MNAARTVLLCILMLILAVTLVGGQLMILAQQTVLRNSFLLPHVERLFSTISAPQTHEDIVRYLVAEILRGTRVRGMTAELREQLMKASVKAFSTQWMEDELLEILNKMLAVLRGRSQTLEYTIYLSSRKDVLLSELTRTMPPEAEREIRAGSAVVPDSVQLESLVGKDLSQTLRLAGSRSILLSLLSIYVVPGLLILIALQVGRVAWGIVGIGSATLASGIAALVALVSVAPGATRELVRSATSSLPSAFSWLPSILHGILADVGSAGRTVALAFTGAGAAVLAAGILVVVLTRKKQP